jgi:hypothetical protein
MDTLKQSAESRAANPTHGFFLSDQKLKQTNPSSWNSAFASRGPLSGRTPNDWENPLVRCGIALSGANHAKQITNAITDNGVLTGLESVAPQFAWNGTRHPERVRF